MDMTNIVKICLTSFLFVFSTVTFSLERVNQHQKGTPGAIKGETLLIASRNTLPIPSPEEDEIITRSIKTHIGNSKILSRFNIDVKTEEGIVTLKGNVDSNSQASRLIELAQSIVGVRDVHSRLTVQRSRQVLRDTIITAKIKGLFIREGIFGPKRGVALMNVETRNGVVHLTGQINNKQKIDRAVNLIRGVNGVKKVEYKFTKITPYDND